LDIYFARLLIRGKLFSPQLKNHGTEAEAAASGEEGEAAGLSLRRQPANGFSKFLNREGLVDYHVYAKRKFARQAVTPRRRL